MSNQEKFEGFDFSHNPYEEEARKKWGDEAVDKGNEKVRKMTTFHQEKFNQIYHKLARLRHLPPDCKEAQESIDEWYQLLNKIGNYPPLAFKELGQIYVDDQRFTKNIDQFGKGLAHFMCEAMAVYADRKNNN